MYANKVGKFANVFGIEHQQTRIIAITDRAIYNIDSKKVKRKVDVKDLYGVTKCQPQSNSSKEFTIHVSGSYDIRYASDE